MSKTLRGASRRLPFLLTLLTAPLRAEEAATGPFAPAALVPSKQSYVALGVAVEGFGGGPAGVDGLIGLAGMWRYHSLGPHALLMAAPSSEGYEDSLFLFGTGLRGYVPVLGTELSYGVALHGELRFADHFWSLYATPLELGAVLYRERTFELELFVGARRVLGGSLIDHFLLDPNGFENEEAQAELDRLKHDDPWRGFVRVVFARRID